MQYWRGGKGVTEEMGRGREEGEGGKGWRKGRGRKDEGRRGEERKEGRDGGGGEEMG